MKSNEKIIAGLTEVVNGLNSIIAELSDGSVEAPAVAEKAPAKKSVGKKSEPVEDAGEAPAVEGSYTKEQLDAMKYNDLKKLGAQMGVSCKGTRDEITARMLEAGGVEVSAEEEAPAEEETPKKKGLSKKADKEDNKVVPIKKGLKKAEAEIPAEFVEQAEEVMKETELKDVIEALAEVGVEAGSKKSEVTKALAKALFEGKIDLEDDGEEAPAEEADNEDDGEEITADTYFEQFDPEGINNPANLSENRAVAITDMMTEVIAGVEDESLTEKDITDFIEEFATEEDKELLGEEYEFVDLLGLYCEIKKRLYDDDGELHEGGDPYEIAEDNYCCGHLLKYDKKSKTYICEVCGEAYEA